MIFTLPGSLKWLQTNRGDFDGFMWSSHNLDTQFNHGKAKTANRLKVNLDSVSDADLSTPVGFVFHHSKWWTSAGQYLFNNDGTATGTFVQDTTTNTPNMGADVSIYSDIISFPISATVSWLIVSSQLDLFRKQGTSDWDASTWWQTTLSQAALGTFPHPMEISRIGAEKLLIGDGPNLRIITQASAVSTLALGVNQRIKWIKSGATRIWIGCVGVVGSGRGMEEGLIYEWDGSSTLPNRSYRTGCIGTYAGILKDEVPYATMADGQIKAYSGGEFVRVAAFANYYSGQPFKGVYDPGSSSAANTNFIHPNGMQIVGGEITLLISNELLDGTFHERVPAGLWKLDDNGLHHVMPLSVSNSVDYGILAIKSGTNTTVPSVGGIKETQQTGSSLFAGGTYDNVSLAIKSAIFHESSSDNKRSILTTPFFKSPSILSNWQTFFLKHKKNQSATFVVKARNGVDTPITGAVTWSSTTQFTSSSDLSTVSVGDEVLILSGAGAGTTVHITAISYSNPTYTVTVDEAALVSATNQSRVLITNWTKISSKTDTGFVSDFPLTKMSASPSIQGRVEIRGSTELEEFITEGEKQQ